MRSHYLSKQIQDKVAMGTTEHKQSRRIRFKRKKNDLVLFFLIPAEETMRYYIAVFAIVLCLGMSIEGGKDETKFGKMDDVILIAALTASTSIVYTAASTS